METVPPENIIYTFNKMALNVSHYTVIRDGVIIPLTTRQFRALQFLVEKPNKTHSRADILSHMYYGESMSGTNPTSVNRAIEGIRKALGQPDVVETVRGVGYKLTTRRFSSRPAKGKVCDGQANISGHPQP